MEEHAVLSTEPTKKGWPMFNEIDKGHDYIPIQYVQGKKLSDFTSNSTGGVYDFPSDVKALCGYEAYLLIERASREGFIKNWSPLTRRRKKKYIVNLLRIL